MQPWRQPSRAQSRRLTQPAVAAAADLGTAPELAVSPKEESAEDAAYMAVCSGEAE